MDKKIEPIYKVMEGKASKLTRDDVRDLIIAQGYNREIAKAVLKELERNKVLFKGDKVVEDKQKLLAEISKSVKPKKQNFFEKLFSKKEEIKENKMLKEEIKQEESKSKKEESVSKKENKKTSQNKVVNFFKRIYFFFEDGYYSIVDGVSKIIPINSITDQIDKVFPSFILFLLLVIGLIYLFLFSGIAIGGSVVSIDVTVTDTANNMLSGSQVILSINDKNLTQTTDAFGNTIFEEAKFTKKDELKLFVSKNSYNPKVKILEYNNRNIVETVVLDIDTTTQLFSDSEKTRELYFKENATLLATKLLQVRLNCSNSGKVPDPSIVNVTTGRLTVTQPAGCGDLRIDVTSDIYNSIQNQIVPEDNTILLSLKTSNNVGKIEVFVKNLQGGAVTSSIVSVYRADDPTTVINESNLVFSTGTTDNYGRYIFENIAPGSYTLSSSKDGFIDSSRVNVQVSINNTSLVNLLMLSPADLQNLDCQNPIFAQFCLNGCLDCNNALLTNFYTRDLNGNLLKTGNCCQIGRLGYVNVSLADSEGITTREIKGDITVYKKNIDNNSLQSIATRRDTNSATFYLLSGSNYKIVVTNTEDYGYFPSDPVDVNTLDRNITIPLEYSSVLNTGIIGVNVKRGNYNYAGSLVYLYNAEDTEIPINSPKTTNSNGDINFTMIRANRDYFAYAVASGYQGQSNTRELDANSFVQLNVNLENQAKVLNLQVNASDYDITFYSLTSQRITDYSINTISDSNKQYIFRDSQNDIYAIISAENKAIYQTDLISLIPGQTVYYKVTLGSPQANAFANIDFLGVYDQSGQNKINAINLAEDRDKTFKLKYKLTTTTKSNRALSYALIRVGKHTTLSSDFLKLSNVFAPGTTFTRGCNYQGQMTDWNIDYFNLYYDRDHSQANCLNDNGFKWAKINFTNNLAEQIEFSVDFKFQNDLTPLDNYVVYYKALTRSNTESYVFSPSPNNSWQDCPIRPQGYFYTPTQSYTLSFDGSNNLSTNFYDWNGTAGNLVEKNGTRYVFNIGNSYLYSQKFLYLISNSNITNKSIRGYSTNTNNYLKYNSYIFKSISGNNTDVNRTGLNVSEYTITGRNASFGTEFDHNSVFNVNNFFNTGAKIDTAILDITAYNPYSKEVLAYYADSNVFIEVLTNDTDNENNIYAGDNTINFRIRDNVGQAISGIAVYYRLPGFNPEISLGVTNENGYLNDQNISLLENQIGEYVQFRFEFPISFGFYNNSVIVNRQIMSGYKLAKPNGQTINTFNPIVYFVGRYVYNGVTEITTDYKDYYIVRKSAKIPLISNINLWARSGFVNIEDTNNYLVEENDFPINLSDTNKLIKTKIYVNLIPSNQTTVVGGYHNTLEIGSFDNQSIVIDLSADARLQKLFDTNISTNLTGITKPGKKLESNKILVELIKSKYTSVNFNYTISNQSLTPITLDINSIKDSTLNGVDLTITPQNYTIPANQSKSFNIKLELQSNVATNLEKPAKIFFNYTINNISFTKEQELLVSVYDSTDIYSIVKTSPSNQIENWLQNLTCSSQDCSTQIIANLKNKTKTYDFSVSNIRFTDSDQNFILNANPETAFNLNANQQRTMTLNIDGNYTKLKGNDQISQNQIFSKNKKLNFVFDLNGVSQQNVDKNINLNLGITLITQSIQQLLEEQGLYGNLCLGFGSSGTGPTETSFNIIGTCDLSEFDSCKRGVDQKPKIEYVWDRTTECVSDLEEGYDTNKIHCDSLQMFFNIFNNINLNLQDLKAGNKYIYLMYDGVSSDLLRDIINFNEFFSGSEMDSWNNTITDANITEEQFTISRTELVNGIQTPTRKPGKYRIRINSGFSTEYSSPLHISLELVREQPYSMRNLLYYIPINGTLGVDSINKRTHRHGYGASIVTDSNLPIIEGVNLYKNSDGNTSVVRIIANNNNVIDNQNQTGLRNTINSDGKLLEINLDSISETGIDLTLNYSPSYPIPLYAKIVNSNNNGFNYVLKNNNSTYDFKLNSFIKWIDSNYESKISKDTSFVDGSGNYFKSQITPETFITNYGTNNSKKLLKTILYWPMSETNLNNLKISLIDLNNSLETKIYTITNLDQNGSMQGTDSFNSIKTYSNFVINSYSKIFELIYDDNSKACMESGLTSVVVKWDKKEIDFSEEQIEKIITDFEYLQEDPIDQEELIEEGGAGQ